MDIRFSVPPADHAAIKEAAARRGFTGQYGVSAFARFLVYDFLHLGPRPRPISAQPTYEDQRIAIEAYAMAMGYDSVGGFALKAMERIMSKEPPTGRKEEAYEALRGKLLAEASRPALAVPLDPIAGKQNGREVT